MFVFQITFFVRITCNSTAIVPVMARLMTVTTNSSMGNSLEQIIFAFKFAKWSSALEICASKKLTFSSSYRHSYDHAKTFYWQFGVSLIVFYRHPVFQLAVTLLSEKESFKKEGKMEYKYWITSEAPHAKSFTGSHCGRSQSGVRNSFLSEFSGILLRIVPRAASFASRLHCPITMLETLQSCSQKSVLLLLSWTQNSFGTSMASSPIRLRHCSLFLSKSNMEHSIPFTVCFLATLWQGVSLPGRQGRTVGELRQNSQGVDWRECPC